MNRFKTLLKTNIHLKNQIIFQEDQLTNTNKGKVIIP